MLVRDVRSGQLVAVPDNRFAPARLGSHGIGYNVPQHPHGLGYYGAAPPQVVYDGLGNPVGLPFLAPLLPILAAKGAALLPLIAGKARAALPSLAAKLASLLPGLASKAAARLPSGSDSAAQLAQLLPQLQALLQQSKAATPQRIGAPMPLGFYAESLPMTPAPSPGPEAMAPQPTPPVTQVPTQASMQTPMQAPMQPAMQSAASPTMAPSPPTLPPGGAPAFAPPDEVVVPMRVQRANGETVVVPVRMRRRRRLRRRFIGFQPAVLQRPLVPGAGFAQGYPGQAANVHGWPGFNGWRGY